MWPFLYNLLVPLSIEIIQYRLLHQDCEEPDDLGVGPVGVSVSLVRGGILQGEVGGQSHPAYLAGEAVVHLVM